MKTDGNVPRLPTAAQILRARAVALARPPESKPAAETQLDVLEFRLAAERYAVEIRHVREVYPLMELTPLPCVPNFVLGVVNVRGRILPVFDLRRLFGLPDQGITDLHRIILVGNEDLEFGLLADVIGSVRSIPLATLQPSLPTLSGIHADYLKGVTPESLVVLNLDRILSDPKIIVHDEVEA